MRPTDERFIRLIHEHDARLRRICRVYAYDTEQEKDLYQEVLLQIWRSLPSFEGRSSVGTWVYRVALNTALGQRRRRSARAELPLEERDAQRVAAPSSPDQQLEGKQRLERMYAAIARLGDVDKALVMLYLDDRTYREMADVLGISESNVGVRLHRIRRQLASWMKESVT